MDKKFKQYLEDYFVRVEKIYGEVPKHCYETQVILGKNPEDAYASGADLQHNIIYLNPDDPDLEWTLYHEMEHIRTAHSINKTMASGVYLETVDNEKGAIGIALTEAMTEISVETLLNRNQEKIGYYEIIQLTRQIAILMNLDDLGLLNYYNKNGIVDLTILCAKLTGDSTIFLSLVICLDELEESHDDDLDYEFSTYGKIKNKLGSFPSEKTKDLRFKFNLLKNKLFDKIKESKCYNKATLREISNKYKSLSPYEEESVVKL